MRTKKILFPIFLCFCFIIKTIAQVSITNINVQAFNIVPDALLNVGIMNNGSEQQVTLLTQVFGANNAVLMTVKSQPFTLVKGLNAGLNGGRRVASVDYSGASQANYIKTSHNLPSGRYKICASVLVGSTEKLDDFCDELEAEFNQYLYLVNPNDGDTVETKNPMLSWAHSEPFSILNQGEFYRMIVTEMKKGQTAEEAVVVNSPLMVKNYLKEHQLQYPYDARELKEGGQYAWQVQKMSDGVIINKTEAWVFNMKRSPETKSLKYVALKNEIDGSFYTAYNGKVFFKFLEEYKTQGQMKYTLTDAKSKNIEIEVAKDIPGNKKEKDITQLKQSGDNLYELDMDSKNLSSGFYTLTVKNEKNESFYLKIFLP